MCLFVDTTLHVQRETTRKTTPNPKNSTISGGEMQTLSVLPP